MRKVFLLIFLLFTFLPVTNLFSQVTDTYNVTGTWVAPAGVTSVTVECWGAGGAGGGNTTGADGAGGGGGGAYSRSVITVIPGNTYTVTVGAGGIGVLGGTGGTGGDSWFINATTILAKGGIGGNPPISGAAGIAGTGGLALQGIGTITFSGGNGGNGNNSNNGIGGGGGSSAGTAANGTNGGIGSGSGGIGGIAPAGGGNGGDGGWRNQDGIAGTAPGGAGGGSGEGNQIGGNGANGQVLITYTVPANPTITLGSNPIVCQGTTSANLTYSATTNSPDQYSINYDVTAEGQGFVDVVNAALPASPIVLVVPAAVISNTYNAVLTVRNSGSGLVSINYAITIAVNALPTTALAGTDQAVSVTTATLAGNTPVVGTGVWTLVSGAGTITTPISPTSGITGLGLGANTFRWTITNLPCTDSWDEVIITYSPSPNPTITLGSNPIVCQGDVIANLTYSATTNSPDQYSINYDAIAEGQGFVDITDAALPVSPIVMVVPVAATPAVYNAILTVKNTGTGLVSGNYAISVTVNITPATPGPISGMATVAPGISGYVYNISPVTYATTYAWSVPAGWTITNGSGTTTITVTSGSLGQDGNITVTAGNSCGTSAAASIAVTIVAATDHSLINCSSCHIFHNSTGVALTNSPGNALLCQSCHVSGGAASNKPLPNADIAIPGTGGTSHAWNVLASNATYETNAPTNTEMSARLSSGNIVCSTCHDQHNSATVSPYLRADNTGDAMCKDCHSARDVGLFASDNVNNRGSHPVGVIYDGADPRFNATPTILQLVGGNVECSSCHGVHDVTGALGLSSDGYLLRTNNDAALCADCHTYGSHNSMTCLDCHQTHNTNKANIYMIKDIIATPNSGNKTVLFTAETGTNSFADGDITYDGICEVCHTITSYHKNDGTGLSHNQATNCTICHTHENAFAPQCNTCHLKAFPNWGTNDSHFAHTSKYSFACNTCHLNYGSGGSLEGVHPSSTLNADSTISLLVPANVNFDPGGLATRNGLDVNTPAFNNVAKTCDNIYCHSNGRSAYRGTDGTYTWSGTTGSQVATYATTPAWTSVVGTINTCGNCHSGTGNMVSPYTITTPGLADPSPPPTGSHLRGAHRSNSQELSGNGWSAVNCFWCHNTVNGDDGSPINQGTYGTTFHVDGQTYFDPRSVVDGGTIVNNPSGGSFSYSYSGSSSHCGNGRTCW